MLDFKRLILAMLHGHLPPHLAFVQDLPRYESFLSLVKRQRSTLETIGDRYPKKHGGHDRAESCSDDFLERFFTDPVQRTVFEKFVMILFSERRVKSGKKRLIDLLKIQCCRTNRHDVRHHKKKCEKSWNKLREYILDICLRYPTRNLQGQNAVGNNSSQETDNPVLVNTMALPLTDMSVDSRIEREDDAPVNSSSQQTTILDYFTPIGQRVLEQVKSMEIPQKRQRVEPRNTMERPLQSIRNLETDRDGDQDE